MVVISRRRCSLDGCGKKLGPDLRSDAKYCCKEHQRKAAARRQSRKRTVREAIEKGKSVSVRVPGSAQERLIQRMHDEGTDELILGGRWTQAEARRFYNVSARMMSAAVGAIRDREVIAEEAVVWMMTPGTAAMLMMNPDGSRNDYTGDPDDLDAAMKWATGAAEAFLEFEETFFELPGGKPWLRKRFHKIWIIELMLAFATGGYLQILSPPRHGKSELMIHFAVWLIARNPDIRILYVAASGKDGVAGDMVASVGHQLARNEPLRLAVLGPAKHWAPATRTGGTKWTREEIEVINRTTIITGSTMVALGRGSKILSRNADVIFCDDIEDYESTKQPAQRRGTRRWFNITLDSRKEEHTPLVVIGSRQHSDDFYGYNLENSNFRCVVDSAHDESCVKDPGDVAGHVDCMLFPEVRSYRWLMSKKEGADSLEEAATYDLVYLNDPQADGITVFVKDEVHGARNWTRKIGLEGIPTKDRRLVAGLDPSATKFQAGFLWALTPMPGRKAENWLQAQDFMMKRWMVDLENRRGGGARNALELMQKWLTEYDLRHWVFEESGAWTGPGSLRHDKEIVLFCRRNDVYVEGLETSGANKWDPTYGLGGQSRLFRDGLIDLPYADERSRTKVNAFTRQVLRFTDDAAAQAKRTTDIHMASWLPTRAIRRIEKEELAEITAQQIETVDSEYPSSYPGLDGFTDWETAPWS